MSAEINLVWLTNDHVRSLAEVNRHGQRAVRGQGLIETPGYIMVDREEGRNGGVVGSETILDRG